MGINLAVDNFTASFSILKYLRSFSINYFKIGKIFNSNILKSTIDKKIITSIISLIHDFDFLVLAKCIENQKQLEFYKNNKCEFLQGFYLNKPVNADEVLKLLKLDKSFLK
jgi:EAL domain-containing protein (putative c-di-GMP-specific phosphodiesterase class I)